MNTISHGVKEVSDIPKISTDDFIQISTDGSILKRKTDESPFQSNSAESRRQPKIEHQHATKKISIQDKIDFGPLHRCCQIFNVLVSEPIKI